VAGPSDSNLRNTDRALAVKPPRMSASLERICATSPPLKLGRLTNAARRDFESAGRNQPRQDRLKRRKLQSEGGTAVVDRPPKEAGRDVDQVASLTARRMTPWRGRRLPSLMYCASRFAWPSSRSALSAPRSAAVAICRASCWLTDVNVFGGFMAGIAFDLQDISGPRIGYQPNAAGRLASVEIPRR